MLRTQTIGVITEGRLNEKDFVQDEDKDEPAGSEDSGVETKLNQCKDDPLHDGKDNNWLYFNEDISSSSSCTDEESRKTQKKVRFIFH